MDRNRLRDLQITQQKHDLENHFEIICLPKSERLKHYGLHFAKYVGRLARNPKSDAELKRTLVDAFLISLCAANALNQRLYQHNWRLDGDCSQIDLLVFADAVGRFADACEKIDHLESFRDIALDANADVVDWILNKADELKFEIEHYAIARRDVLATRQAYHAEH